MRRTVDELIADHRTRLAHYQAMAARDFPEPDRLTGHELDVYLVLRGGIRLERFWVDWLTEYRDAHADNTVVSTSSTTRADEGASR